MGAVQVELTGRLRVTAEDGRSIDAASFPGRQSLLVFVYLLLHERPVPREELAEVLWPGGPPGNWKRDLSALVSRLRRLLRSVGVERAAFLTDGGCYELRLPAGSAVDVREAAAQASEAASATGHSSGQPCAT